MTSTTPSPERGTRASSPPYDLAGKVVLITGGTGGIGLATARELVGRGAHVAVADIHPDTAAIAGRISSGTLGVVADVRDRAGLDNAVAEAVARFGRLDVVIANAGVLARAGTLRVTDPAAVEALFAVNIQGVVNTVGAALEQVVAHRGQIVLLSSVFAYLNGMATIPYAMSKAAVEQLGRGLRVELAAHGVTTTTVYFSLIDTDMIKNGVDGDVAATALMATLPSPLLERLSPEAAATAIVGGLERRSPRVMVPARWRPFSALRGLLGPVLDARLVTDRRTQAALAPLDGRPSRTPPAARTPDTTKDPAMTATTWATAPNRTVDVDGVPFVYRDLGTDTTGVPVVFLHHLTAVLDDWDPRVLDGLAAHHRVIAFDNRGVGASGGSVPHTVDEMGRDAIAFLRALGLEQVDLFGFSLGGGVAQMVALQAPQLVRRMVLAGTGPKGGGGISEVTRVTALAYAKAALTRSDPRNFLFFPRDAQGRRAAADYLGRLAERTRDRDRRISLPAILAQLRAIRAAGKAAPDDLSVITQPVLVANGDHDLMVQSDNSADMVRRLPDAELVIYPDSGHGGVFQHHERFVPRVVQFLGERRGRFTDTGPRTSWDYGRQTPG